MPFTDLGLQPHTIVTHHFCHDLKDRYQATPLCWVGDIGDSIYKPEDHLLETFSDMLAVGMNFDREDFSLWSPIMRSEHFLARFETYIQQLKCQVSVNFSVLFSRPEQFRPIIILPQA